MKICAILLAAGSSVRMGADVGGRPRNKMLLRFFGKTPIEICTEAFQPHVDEIVIAVSESTRAVAEDIALKAVIPTRIVNGGARRQDSVLNAIRATDADIVAIHDCARCLVTSNVITASILSAKTHGCGIASLPLRDTIRSTDNSRTIDRQGINAAQTPQSFHRQRLLLAYEIADGEFTDDASVWLAAGNELYLSSGDIANQKLTEPGDITFFQNILSERGKRTMRIGIGEDTHRLTENRRLILGGVDIPFKLGLLGHSDADVLVHAVMDALLGAASMGDIGQSFPDSDAAYKDVSSIGLLRKVAAMLCSRGFRVSNVDCVVTAQAPKLSPYRDVMQKNIADALGVDNDNISIKFTTTEGMNAEGRSECITARAVAAILRL